MQRFGLTRLTAKLTYDTVATNASDDATALAKWAATVPITSLLVEAEAKASLLLSCLATAHTKEAEARAASPSREQYWRNLERTPSQKRLRRLADAPVELLRDAPFVVSGETMVRRFVMCFGVGSELDGPVLPTFAVGWVVHAPDPGAEEA